MFQYRFPRAKYCFSYAIRPQIRPSTYLRSLILVCFWFWSALDFDLPLSLVFLCFWSPLLLVCLWFRFPFDFGFPLILVSKVGNHLKVKVCLSTCSVSSDLPFNFGLTDPGTHGEIDFWFLMNHLNQTIFSDWFWTKWNSVCFQINRKIMNKIWYRLSQQESKDGFSVRAWCSNLGWQFRSGEKYIFGG